MAISKLQTGLYSIEAKGLHMLGLGMEDSGKIATNTHPHVYRSKDKFCLYIRASDVYDLNVKSASGKSETKVGARITPAADIRLVSRSMSDQYRVMLELNPELYRLGPVSFPSILEPDLLEPITATVWKLGGQEADIDLRKITYLYRLYMFT